MGGSYVVNGAKVSCSMGSVEVPLRTTPGRSVKLRGKDRANIADCIPLVNVGDILELYSYPHCFFIRLA